MLSNRYPLRLIEGLFTSWTMKLALVPLKYVTGHWAHPRFTLVYIKKNKCKSDRGIWGPPKTLYLGSKIPISLVQVIWDESAKNLWGTSFYVGWMRGTSPSTFLHCKVKAAFTHWVIQSPYFAHARCSELVAKISKWWPWGPRFESLGPPPLA